MVRDDKKLRDILTQFAADLALICQQAPPHPQAQDSAIKALIHQTVVRNTQPPQAGPDGWHVIDGSSDGSRYQGTERWWVPGGWLVRVRETFVQQTGKFEEMGHGVMAREVPPPVPVTLALTYVPDPDHEWVVR